MLSPEEIHAIYSKTPCTSSLESPYTQLSSAEVFNRVSANEMGAGTPINWRRIIHFFKHVKYPCVEAAPGYSSIEGTGGGALCLSFRFLQHLDNDAYKEQQPTVRSGTSHSVRNACDLARACKLDVEGNTKNWSHRMATEYLEFFAHNSIADCFMMCGPDLVSNAVAAYYRAPGVKAGKGELSSTGGITGASQEDPNGVELDKAVNFLPGMECFIKTPKGVAGGGHACASYPEDDGVYCDSCGICEEDPVTGAVIDPDHPCCKEGTIFYYNMCCGNQMTDRLDFSYWVPSDDGSFDGTINGGRIDEILQHVGILLRKNYGGYANFTSQCSGSNPPIILKDQFLKRFQESNGWNYEKNITKAIDDQYSSTKIDRARTISLILKGTATSRNAQVSTDKDWMLGRIKDLVFNGYGVLLLTNVGFPNIRDSTGVVFPDRIFYHTYNIVGYDDTFTAFDECVYVLHCPFGNWISGGHPEWGELPTGCFLVTESILRSMIDYYPGADFYGCRREPCPDELSDEECQLRSQEFAGCGGGYENQCTPYYCSKKQRATGLLFAVSLNEGFPKQELDHTKYYEYRGVREKIKESNREG